MTWVFQRAQEVFDRNREWWDEVNRNQGNHILLDSAFIWPLVRYFGSPGTLLGISNDPNRPGVALVNQTMTGFWQTFQPAQAPLGLIILGIGNGVDEQIQSLVCSLPGYALGFSVVQQDPECSVFQHFTDCRKVESVDWRKTARITLSGTFEEYWKNRSRKLVRELARQRRRLAENRIHLEFVVDREPDRVTECVREYAILESSGWKGREGTAITEENVQGQFYKEMLEGFCRRGEGVIYRLLLNGKTAACELCIERNGVLVDLKTTYDESLVGISPGSLLQEEMLKHFFLEGKVRVVEFYGPVLEWTTKWTNEIRPMFHYNFYRHSWVRKLRGILKQMNSFRPQNEE